MNDLDSLLSNKVVLPLSKDPGSITVESLHFSRDITIPRKHAQPVLVSHACILATGEKVVDDPEWSVVHDAMLSTVDDEDESRTHTSSSRSSGPYVRRSSRKV